MQKTGGLSQKDYQQIIGVFESFPQVEKVILYGSRATQKHRPNSDIDLTLFGETLDTSLLLKIENAIDDLLLPYKVDLSLYTQIDNENLKANINSQGIIFYKK